MNQMRVEHDGLGELEIPEMAYYGIVSERNRRAFDVGPLTLDDYPSYIRSVALCKIACARANVEIGALDSEKAKYIELAAREVADGKMKGQFIVNIYRGSGTPTNMIVNEVVAHRANELMTGSKTGPIHPNTHVNMCQSTNDLVPTAKEMVVYEELGKVIEATEVLQDSLQKKAAEFADVIKMGRTCLQDAVPLTLGQEFGAFAHAAGRLVKRLKLEREHWNKSCLGGTAVGTGMSCLPGFRQVIAKHLSDVCGRPIETEEDLFDGMMATDGLVIAHAHVQALATLVWKMARDIRLLASGPRAGFGEINLPAVAPGSSIMPGKVNPALPELMNVVAYHVVGADAAVTMAVEGGELELNVWEPVIIINLLGAAKVLANAMPLFATRCVATITVNQERCLADAEKSLASAAVVSALVGYKKGTQVAHLASEKNLTIKEAAVLSGYLTREEAERFLDPVMLANAKKSGKLLLDIALKEHRIR